MTISTPTPKDAWEIQRWDHARLRLRLLEGTWRQDLIEQLYKTVGPTRARSWGDPSLAVNPFANICRELAVLYNQTPVIRNEAADISAFVEEIRLSGLWSMMQQVQVKTIGLREFLVRVSISSDGTPLFRPVSPDMVLATSSLDKPDLPISVRELRLRDYEGEPTWTMDYLDISDPEYPVYAVYLVNQDCEFTGDVTTYYWGQEMSGANYPFRRTASGKPFLPYVLYHAEKNGYKLWDPYTWIELVENTLEAAVMSQMVIHCFKDASWPQRYAVGARPLGAGLADSSGDARRFEVVSDPATLLLLEPIEGFAGQPSVGQFQPGADVAMLEETLSNYVSRIAQDAGVPPSDVQRLGGTARSGAAISLSNEGKRAAQRRYQETFSDSDERLLSITASLLNAFNKTNYPEGGYQVNYTELPLSPEELKAKDDHILSLVEAGLMSKVNAYIELNPGISRADAIKELREELFDANKAASLIDKLAMINTDPAAHTILMQLLSLIAS